MKTKVLLGSLLALSGIANAQWTTSGTDIYNSNTGNVGIGTTAPTAKLNVSTTGGTQMYLQRTAGQINGLKVFFTSSPAVGVSVGAGSTIFQNQATVSDMLFMHNPTTAGMILRYTGNVGIGTTNPTNGKFEVSTDPTTTFNKTAGYFTANAELSSDYYGVYGRAYSSNGQGTWQVGVQGEGVTASGACGSGQNMGFWGKGEGAVSNVGGLFIAGGTVNPGSCCQTNIGVWGTIGGYCNTSWAGYFNGNVGATGSFITTSDRALKKDIRPMENMLEKVMRLKPSTYTFKTDEQLKDLHLPTGNQLGLIAQDLEEVFPELVSQVSDMKAKNGDKEISTPAFKGVQYLPLIPVLVSAIQDQQKLITSQQQQLDEQKEMIAALQQKNGTATGINSNNPGAAGFSMSQNEPNPFNSETVINYTLPQTVGTAAMYVYDLTGKQIATYPISNTSSSLTITSEKLSAGIYIYSIIADGKVMDSKRMVVANK